MKEQFPTIIIKSNKNSTGTNNLFRIFDNELFSLEIKEDYKNEFIIHNDNHFFLFAHVSIRFRKIIETNINHFLNQDYLTKKSIAKLDWGFVLIYSKSTNRILIYNDVYGIYPLFYAEQDRS
ncbi:MAG: hypothetical protein P1P88_18620, partial [Bacteroidales bacterium]|nr:hypothetical protein [Bacteroidales bacterium]